ncbi:MAG: hypothetical protein RLZZ524_936 [Pseudomonadota bacterium]|jgi:uncharacterized membrane protein
MSLPAGFEWVVIGIVFLAMLAAPVIIAHRRRSPRMGMVLACSLGALLTAIIVPVALALLVIAFVVAVQPVPPRRRSRTDDP